MKILLIAGGLFLLLKWMNRNGISRIVRKTARKFNIPSRLVFAIVQVESGGNPRAVGRAGEIGLMQIKPATAKMMGYDGSDEGLFHPETNIFFGTSYLAWWRDKGYSVEEIAAGYNAGKVARRADGEFINQGYVDKIIALYNDPSCIS